MAFQTHKNFAYSTVATAPSPAASGTSLVVAAGEGTYFPAVPFQASIWPVTTIPTPANAEVVTVTAVSTDTLTITRAQESSSARTVVVGDQIAATITNKTLTDIETVSAPTEQTTTATGAQADFSLTNGFTFLRCTGAAPVFSGFTVAGGAPSAGDRVLILCLGTTAKVTTQDTGSTEANRIIAPSTNGQIVGVNGLMLLVYDATTARWRESVVEPGAYINVTYSSGNFTGNDSMTWTVDSGDLVVFSYQQRGNNLHIVVGVEASSVGGTPSTDLQIAFPAGFTPTYSGSSTLFDVGFGINAGTLETVRILAGSTTISAIRIAGANWAASTNTTRVYINHMFTVQ